MNNSRIRLDAELRQLAGNNVYFQPPESLKLQYPAIVYKRKPTRYTHADNINYITHPVYQLVVIDSDPDSELVERMNNFRTAREVSRYSKAGQNYTVFELEYK